MIDDAIRFVSSKTKGNLKLSRNSDENGKESIEPDYDEEEDQVGEDQEEETGKTTVNEVF